LKNIFVFGYYGFDNAGDEIILKEIVNSLKESDTSFYILTYNYIRTKKRTGENPVSRSKFINVIKSIMKSDIVVGGGGSLIQDVTSSKSLYYYLGLITLGKICRKKVLFLFSGFGPVKGKFNRFLTRFILNKIDYIVLRDRLSEDFLKDLKINVPYKLAGDAAFLRDKICFHKENKSAKEKVVGISLRKWTSNKKVLEEVSKVINYLVEKGYTIKLIPMKFPDDYDYMKGLMDSDNEKISIIDDYKEFDDLCNVLGQCEFIIGMRLHSLILSALVGKPMIGLSYDPKIDGFLESFQQINHGKVENIDFERLKKDITLLEDNYEYYENTVVEKTKEMKNINSEVIKEVKDKFIQ